MTATTLKKESPSDAKHDPKAPAAIDGTKSKAGADSRSSAASKKADSKAHGGNASTTATANKRQTAASAAPSAGPMPKLRGHHDAEPNPFEQSFRGPSEGGEGKAPLLPGVANLTSPGGGLGGVGQLSGWSSFGSLRNGPLSPAMLLGPTGLGGFDGTLRTGLTPNESSIRTGLTPRADGQFPMPSPGTQALLGLMEGSNGLLPGGPGYTLSSPGGGQYSTDGLYNRPHMPSNLGANSVTAEQAGQQSHDGQHNGRGAQDTDAAANGLFLLAQHSQQHQQQQQQHDPRGHGMRGPTMPPPVVNGQYGRPPAPAAQNPTQAATRPPKAAPTADNGVTAKKGRRKDSQDDTATKPTKRGKTAKAAKSSISSSDGEDDAGHDFDGDDGGDDKKFENDEDKRRNFLERNRQAALKCRQRKKQWLANLQAKVEFYGQENDSLTSQVSSLREEIVNLKTLLMQHKDCPVTAAHGGNLGF